jgi:hypothetical protein
MLKAVQVYFKVYGKAEGVVGRQRAGTVRPGSKPTSEG